MKKEEETVTDFRLIGKIKHQKEGNFPDTVDAVIELVSGDDQWVTVGKRTREGAPAKVWPMFIDSFDNGTVYAWTGTLKKGDKKDFYRVTYAFRPSPAELQSDDPGPDPGRYTSVATIDPVPEWNSVEKSWGSEARPEPAELLAQSIANVAGKAERETDTEREAEWAIATVLLTPFRRQDDYSEEQLFERAMQHVVTKRRLAAELRGAK